MPFDTHKSMSVGQLCNTLKLHINFGGITPESTLLHEEAFEPTAIEYLAMCGWMRVDIIYALSSARVSSLEFAGNFMWPP